jgi:hypothetical protein
MTRLHLIGLLLGFSIGAACITYGAGQPEPARQQMPVIYPD